MNQEDKQKELMTLLKELTIRNLSDVEIKGKAGQFSKVYSDNFRHEYSYFFPFVAQTQESKPTEDGLDCLANNIQEIRRFIEQSRKYSADNYNHFRESFQKLCDHINLEIGRCNYYSRNEQKLSDIKKQFDDVREQSEAVYKKFQEAGEEIRNADEELKKCRDELQMAKQKLESVQTEVISVLSIFAAIVLTFAGGLSLLGNAFSSIKDVSIYKITFLCIICGLVLCNAIFIMMYLVGKITRRNIYARCKTANCTCNPQCKGLRRVKNRLPYVYWLNVLFLVLAVIDVAIWYLDQAFHIFAFSWA